MVEVNSEKPDSDAGHRSQSFEVRLVAIGNGLFFDAQPSLSRKERDELPFGFLPLHALGRVDVERDFLRVAVLEGDWVNQALPESLRTPKGDDPAVITASTAELRALLGREADNPKAFALAMYLCRPGTDCATRAVDDMLARAPDDLETLEQAAKFFLRHGDYGRAVASRRRLAELEPEKTQRRADLGEALLFNREFEAARREFGAAVELPSGARARAQEGIVWSYFLEGRFTDASNASDSYRSIAANGSANVILLGHLSRLRIGDRAAADAWLKREAASFIGSPDDQILLLSLEKRVKEPPGYREPTDVERAESLHSAIISLVGGDREVGRECAGAGAPARTKRQSDRPGREDRTGSAAIGHHKVRWSGRALTGSAPPASGRCPPARCASTASICGPERRSGR